MADRYSFQSPFSQGSGGDPWFTVGSIAVNTTTFVTGLGVLGVIFAFIPGINNLLVLTDAAILRGHVWRFVTYPIVFGNDFFFGLLGLIFFYMIGSQFERLVGRRAFTSLMVAIVVIPAVLGALVAVLTNTGVSAFGLSLPFLGIAAGFSAANPQARSFFNIPFWVIVAFFFVVQLLSALSAGAAASIIMLLATAAIGLVMTRSLGFSSVEWIPSIALPSLVTGEGVQSTPRDAKPSKRKRGKKSKDRSHLQAVPAPTSRATEAEIDALLDQVNAFGIDSLSKDQKKTLERHAEEMKKRREG